MTEHQDREFVSDDGDYKVYKDHYLGLLVFSKNHKGPQEHSPPQNQSPR